MARKNTSSITHRFEVITPEQALKYMESAVENRTIRSEDVEKYARDMEQGKWVLNGETIKFDNQGRLFDGQNRLRALIKANAPTEMEIVEGYDTSVMSTVDSGRARCAADVLKIHGIKNGHILTEAIKRIYGYKNNCTRRTSARVRVKLSNEHILEFVKDNPIIAKMAIDPIVNNSVKVTNPCLVLAFWFLFHNKNKKQAREFMEGLINGIGLGKDDPILAFRKLLLERKMSPNKMDFLSTGDLYGLYIKTWNMWRRDEKTKKVSIKNDEMFERII